MKKWMKSWLNGRMDGWINGGGGGWMNEDLIITVLNMWNIAMYMLQDDRLTKRSQLQVSGHLVAESTGPSATSQGLHLQQPTFQLGLLPHSVPSILRTKQTTARWTALLIQVNCLAILVLWLFPTFLFHQRLHSSQQGMLRRQRRLDNYFHPGQTKSLYLWLEEQEL